MFVFYSTLLGLGIVGLLTLFVVKMVEFRRTPVSGFLTSLSVQWDPVLEKKIKALYTYFKRSGHKHTARKVARKSMLATFHFFGHAGLWLRGHYERFASWIAGKRTLSKRGGVSFFLKDVAESKAKREEEK